jgi:hypothetical protein
MSLNPGSDFSLEAGGPERRSPGGTGLPLLASSTTFRVRTSASPSSKAWVARVALFRAPLGRPAGVVGLPGFERAHACFSPVFSGQLYALGPQAVLWPGPRCSPVGLARDLVPRRLNLTPGTSGSARHRFNSQDTLAALWPQIPQFYEPLTACGPVLPDFREIASENQ